MCKLIMIVAASALVACALGASAAPAPSADTCASDAVEYLRAYKVDADMATLVTEMKKFYPKLEDLVKGEPSKEFLGAMTKLGPKPCCEKLIEHFSQLELLVPCVTEHFDYEKLNKMVQESETARPVAEANHACLASMSFAA